MQKKKKSTVCSLKCSVWFRVCDLAKRTDFLTLQTAALCSSSTTNLLILLCKTPATPKPIWLHNPASMWGNNKDKSLSSIGMLSYLLQAMSKTSHTSCPQAADLDPLPSPFLVLMGHLTGQRDGLQVIQRLLLAAASLALHLSQWVHHRHVHVQVVGLLKTFLANLARKLQVCLCLVLGHVVF